jgi:hypothetical protein
MALKNSLNQASAPFTVTAGDLTVTNLTGTYGGVTLSGTTGIISHVENPTTDGQLLISAAAGTDPIWASLTAGTNISITPGANSISIAATGVGISWAGKTSSFAMVAQNGYITNHAVTLVVGTLPATAVVGDIFEITNIGAAGFKVTQNAAQYINFGNSTTTVGTGGSLASSAIGDSLRIVCVVTDDGFQVLSSVGNIDLI